MGFEGWSVVGLGWSWRGGGMLGMGVVTCWMAVGAVAVAVECGVQQHRPASGHVA